MKYYDPNIDLVYNDSKLLSKLAKIRAEKDGLVCGAVRIFKNGEVIQDVTSNLVVGLGRQFVAQRLFNIVHPTETEFATNDPDNPPVYEWTVSHFGVGNGGATTIGDYTQLLGPDICDQDLYHAHQLSHKDPQYLTSPGDIVKGIEQVEYVVKPIKPTGSIDLVFGDDINCVQGRIYSYVRVVCDIFPGEPDYLPNDFDYININEAGLYYTNGKLQDKAKLRLFAHICFPGKYVEKSSEFVIEWYIMC